MIEVKTGTLNCNENKVENIQLIVLIFLRFLHIL